MSKIAAEHRRVSAPPPASPTLRPHGWVGAMVAESAVGRDVRDGDVFAISNRYGTERGAVSQGPASMTVWLRVVSGGAVGPATSRDGHRVDARDGTNSLLTVGPSNGVGGNCSSVSLEMRGATTAGPLCADEPESGAGRGLVDVGARAIKLASVDWRGA